MLPQNYNVAFKKQLGNVCNFKFGIKVTIYMQIKATLVGWSESGQDKNLKNKVSARSAFGPPSSWPRLPLGGRVLGESQQNPGGATQTTGTMPRGGRESPAHDLGVRLGSYCSFMGGANGLDVGFGRGSFEVRVSRIVFILPVQRRFWTLRERVCLPFPF